MSTETMRAHFSYGVELFSLKKTLQKYFSNSYFSVFVWEETFFRQIALYGCKI